MLVGARSHRGMVREMNEDSILVKPGLYAVADGMGGHNAGEVASATAVKMLDELNLDETWASAKPETVLEQAINRINNCIYAMSLTDSRYSGMGTTLTAIILRGSCGVVGHVGDSRAYLIQGDTISRITEDHSVTSELIKGGGLTEEEAKEHPFRNILTRALGTEPSIAVDTYLLDLSDADYLLLCTDGLTSTLEEDEVLRIINSDSFPSTAVDSLVSTVNKRGGPDNTSVILIRMD
jgi:serine/threonine protein phosphatase PrpC